MKPILLFLLLFHLKPIFCAKILAMMVDASPSHHIWNSAITNELARRGHEVTYFGPGKVANPLPNLRQITSEGVFEKLHAGINMEQMVEGQGVLDLMEGLNKYSHLNCKFIMESKAFDEILKIVINEKFDLIMFDITITECVLPIAEELQGVPVIGVSAYGGNALNNYLTGNPEMVAVRANAYLQLPNNMTLVERTQNVLVYLYMMYDRFYNYLPKQLEYARTKFPNTKNIHAVLDRLSLVLANIHFSIDNALPAVPGLVNVGGLHIKPPKPLPDDLQKFLNESTHGAILFSLGTNVHSSHLSEEKRKILLNVFRELAPIRVLWKFEKDLPGKPENVMIKKWLPQSDILGHPNIKLFFTHSGLLSTQEAVYHGKPIIGMPFLVDQFININKCVREGLGEKVDFLTLNKENLLQTIKKVWNNPEYKEKVEKLSQIFKDRPKTPLETASFWIEYVIRHKGARHLRCASLNLPWYQNNLLDVVLILSVGLILVLFAIDIILKFILKCTVAGKKKN